MKMVNKANVEWTGGLYSWDDLRILLNETNLGADWFFILKLPVREIKHCIAQQAFEIHGDRL